MILVVEAMSVAFVEQFWAFVQEGQYERQEKSEDGRKYYRFLKPQNKDFPTQVELFCRVPDAVILQEPAHLTPIPIDDDVSSLSAILLNSDYYTYVLEQSMMKNGLHLANPSALICLKAKAFLELSDRKEQGQQIDSKNISKHKSDVFRLLVLLAEGDQFELPASIKADMQAFVQTVGHHLPENEIFKAMGLGNIDVAALFQRLISNFNLTN